MTTMPRHALLATLMLCAQAGCSFIYGDELDKKQCQSNADCEAAAARLGAPLVCRESACQAPTCSTSSECPSNATCVQNLCVAGEVDAGDTRVACTQDSECGMDRRCGYDGFCYEKWGCLDKDPDWPAAAPQFDFHTALRRIESTDPSLVGDVVVSACILSDPSCSSSTALKADATVSSDKVLTVPFSGIGPSGFVGAIRISPPVLESDAGVASASDFFPNYVHFTAENPLVGPFTTPGPIFLIPESRFQLLQSFVGVTADPKAANTFLRVYDCGGRSASGVSMTPTGTSDFIFIPLQGQAGQFAPVLGSNKTTQDGTAILSNLPPNMSQRFILRDEDSGRVLTETFNFIARGMAVNYVMYYPRYQAVAAWLAEEARQREAAP